MKGNKKSNKQIEKAKDFKGTAKKIFKKYLLDYKWQLLIVLIFAIGSTVFTIVGPKISGNATTEIFNGLVNKMSGTGGIDFAKIASILLTLVVLYVISMIFTAIQSFVMTNVSQKLTYRLRNEVAQKINHLPMKYFDKKTNGEVLSVITNDIDTFSQNMNQSITSIITAVCTLIGVLIMMLTISVSMTLVSLAIIPVAVILVKFIVKKSQKYFKQQQDYLGHINGQVEEIYGGHTIVKVFNRENEEAEAFAKLNDELYTSGWKSHFMSGLMYPIMQFAGNVGYVGIAVLGGYLAVQGKITVGNIQSFIQYDKQFTRPINEIAEISSMLQAMAAASERILEFLEEPEEEKDPENAISTEGIKGNVRFDHVQFGYNEDKVIIHDFNENVKDGQKIAIVGPTGAGKTTMVNLLMKFYDIHDGDITIDGKSISNLTRENVHSLFTMVLQDTWLFEGTVKDNIRYNNSKITDKEIESVCKYIGLDHFIKTLPNNYDTVISENDNISAGQKQLLTIARGMCEKAPLLILDEATSNVDTRTEELVQKAMDKLMENKTSFIIAHRLSTIKNADLILVMNEGNIIEQGSHDELMKKDGFYAKLYNSQFEL